MPGVTERIDPFLTYKFDVKIEKPGGGSAIIAAFTECTISGWSVKVTPLQEGGLHHYTHRLLGPAEGDAKVTLKRGLVNASLVGWLASVMKGDLSDAARTVTVTLYNAQGQSVFIWNFLEAYPVRWEGPTFNAAENTIAMETLELVYHDFSLQLKD
ncbi:MAG: phage tail protein [Anaerolineae bacterium]|nr:phage tail protein [Anaerolineae bacterium]